MVTARREDDQGWPGAVFDENFENGRVSGTIRGPEQDKKVPAPCDGLFRGSGPDEQAHEQPEIVPGDVDQIALMDVLPAPQPRPAQTTPVQDVSKGGSRHRTGEIARLAARTGNIGPLMCWLPREPV